MIFYELFFLSKTALFNGIREDEIEHLISCLNVSRKTYTKSEVICHAGNRVHEIGLVLSESVSSSTFFDLLMLVF